MTQTVTEELRNKGGVHLYVRVGVFVCALALPITETKPVLQVNLQFHSLHHFHKQPTVCNVKYDLYVLFLNNMKQQPLEMQHELDQKNPLAFRKNGRERKSNVGEL